MNRINRMAGDTAPDLILSIPFHPVRNDGGPVTGRAKPCGAGRILLQRHHASATRPEAVIRFL